MFCPNCGKELPNDAVVCPNCGTSQTDETSVTVSNVVQKNENVPYAVPQTGVAVQKKQAPLKIIIPAVAVVLVLAILAIIFVPKLFGGSSAGAGKNLLVYTVDDELFVYNASQLTPYSVNENIDGLYNVKLNKERNIIYYLSNNRLYYKTLMDIYQKNATAEQIDNDVDSYYLTDNGNQLYYKSQNDLKTWDSSGRKIKVEENVYDIYSDDKYLIYSIQKDSKYSLRYIGSNGESTKIKGSDNSRILTVEDDTLYFFEYSENKTEIWSYNLAAETMNNNDKPIFTMDLDSKNCRILTVYNGQVYYTEEDADDPYKVRIYCGDKDHALGNTYNDVEYQKSEDILIIRGETVKNDSEDRCYDYYILNKDRQSVLSSDKCYYSYVYDKINDYLYMADYNYDVSLVSVAKSDAEVVNSDLGGIKNICINDDGSVVYIDHSYDVQIANSSNDLVDGVKTNLIGEAQNSYGLLSVNRNAVYFINDDDELVYYDGTKVTRIDNDVDNINLI